MQTKEIPREQWTSFLDGFSRRHENWSISVDILSPDLGPQTEIRQIALRGISADEKDGENSIAIMTGKEAGTGTTHVVQQPNRIWIEQTEEGEERSIEIESNTGIKTLVRFRRTVGPSDPHSPGR